MAQILNQDEIDALMGVGDQQEAEQLNSDQLKSMVSKDPNRRMAAYNFKRPRLFSQDQMRVLNQVHEAFGRNLSVYLSAQLRTIVDINLSALDQVLYAEFVMSSAPPSALFVVDAVGRNQKIVFEMDPRLVIFTIEKLFGGPGEFLKKPRETSQIEQRIMSKVMNRAFRELGESWSQIADLEFQESAFESNAEFVQIIPGSEPAIVGTFEVSVYEQRSFINICYPYILLERSLGRTGMKQWMRSTETEVAPEVRQAYEGNVRDINMEMRAELGRTKLNLEQLMDLEAGDVILLNQRKDEPIHVYVGDNAKFRAAAGKSGNMRALRVLDVVHEEDDQGNDVKQKQDTPSGQGDE